MRARAPALASVLALAAHQAAAQSATDDGDLFPEDEQILRFGTSERNVTLAPYLQYDLGHVDTDLPGVTGGQGNELRRARLYVFGTYGDLSGTLAQNFDNDGFPLAYAFATYAATDTWSLRLGQQDEPFSLQDMSGSRFLPFAEAGLNAAISPGDNFGLSALRYGDRTSLAVGLYGGDFNTGIDDEGLALTGRATWAPVYEEGRITRGGDATKSGVGTQRVERLVHLGLGASARLDIEEPFAFSGGGGSVLVDSALTTSPTLEGADSLTRVNLEFAALDDAVSIQAELTGAMVDGPGAEGFVHGGYLYTSYFLTGERRGYSPSSGQFGRVVPKSAVDDGGWGAHEVGGRVTYLDLSDLGPEAGAQVQLSAVFNVYLTKRFVVTTDFTVTRLTDGPNEGEETQAITLRGQIAY